MASRSRSAAAPVGPPARLAAATAAPAGGVPHRPEHVLGAAARPSTVARPAASDPRPTRCDRPARTCVGQHAGARAGRPSARRDQHRQPARRRRRSSRRSSCRSRRSGSASAPPIGPSSRASASVVVQISRDRARHPGAASRTARPRAARPAAPRRRPPRRNAGDDQGPAQRRPVPLGGADDHRHLAPGQAVEQVRAAAAGRPRTRPPRRRCAACAPRPGPAAYRGPGAGRGARPGPGSRAATRRLSCEQRRAGPPGRAQRDHRHRRRPPARTRPGSADRVRVGAAEGVDRLVRVADRDQLVGAGREHPQQLLLGRVDVLVLVDEHPPAPGPLPGSSCGSVLSASSAARISSAGSYASGPSPASAVTSRYSSKKCAAATQSSRPRSPAPVRPAGPGRPRARPRAAAGRAAPAAKPRVSSAGRSAGGQRRCRARPRRRAARAHEVLLRAGQQPRRRARPGRRPAPAAARTRTSGRCGPAAHGWCGRAAR